MFREAVAFPGTVCANSKGAKGVSFLRLPPQDRLSGVAEGSAPAELWAEPISRLRLRNDTVVVRMEYANSETAPTLRINGQTGIFW